MKRLLLLCFTLTLLRLSVDAQQKYSVTDSVVVTSINSTVRDWARGFDFTPAVNVTITDLGKRVPASAGTFIWKIFNTNTQQLIHQQTSNSNVINNWDYEPITSTVTLQAGTMYSLILYGDSSGYFFGASSQINSNFTYHILRYCNNCYPGQPFPTQTATNLHYGTPDFLFILCNPSSSTFSDTACLSYMSPSGKTWTTSGNYMDTIPNAQGCDSVMTINLTVKTVDTSTSLSGFTITANAAGAGYQWIQCDSNGYSPIPGATSQNYTATANGNYAVVVTENGCTDTSACVTISGVSIKEHQFDIATIQPNPFNDRLTIRLEHNMREASYNLTSITGRLVLRGRMAGNSEVLNLSTLAKGVYLLQVNTKHGQEVIRVVKE